VLYKVRTLRIALIKYAIGLKDIKDSLIRASDPYILHELTIYVFRVGSRVLEDISFVKIYKGFLSTRTW
jgi:hypothetical protein